MGAQDQRLKTCDAVLAVPWRAPVSEWVKLVGDQSMQKTHHASGLGVEVESAEVDHGGGPPVSACQSAQREQASSHRTGEPPLPTCKGTEGGSPRTEIADVAKEVSAPTLDGIGWVSQMDSFTYLAPSRPA